MTGHVTPSPAVASDQDTDLSITVAITGQDPIVLDAGAPPGTVVKFACNVGDTGSITQVDTNANGPSVASVPLNFTVAEPGPVGVPG